KRNILGQLIEKQSRKVSGRNGQSKDEGISRTRFDYDPITGNLTKARNHHSSVELAYDELDRLIGETTVHNGQSATVGYRYDPLGNRIRTILPDGRHIDYLYYGSGHLHQISLDGEVITDIERDKLHREIQRTQGSISSLYDYDPMGRLKSQRTVWSGTPTPRGKQNPLAGGAVNRRYAYDKAGNLIQSADQRSGVLNYVYDKIGRIQEARNSQTGRSETFAFDPAHNILSDKAAEGKGSNISSGNRLKEYNGIEYTYDALGNLIYRQLPNGENQYYQYDLENQLVRAEIKKPAGNTEIWTYAYDPFGRRFSKERQDKLAWTSTEPKRTHFVWDGSRLLQEYTYKGSYTYIYTDQDSYEPLAQIFDNAKDGKQYIAYFHTDQVGIPREMTDIHGNLLWYGEYTAWGRLKKDERVYKNAHQPFRLQNQYYDEETGLHYNLMRYYEAETGRFVNQDPIGLFGGDNLYSFGNQVLDFIDPLGLKIYGHRKNGTFRKKPGPKSKKKSAGKGECIQNKKDGDAREALHKKDLDAQYGADRILSQKHLRNKKGEIVRDPVTGESRKLDFVIKGAGKKGGGLAQEITSKTASKRSQLAKEERIRDAGGVYVRDGKSLVHVDGISEIIRLP
ncbi:RHS protein, partial [Neisseria sicca VK64]